MLKKSKILVLLFSALLSAGVSATSIDSQSQLTQSAFGSQLEYNAMGKMPLGAEGGPSLYPVPVFVRGGFNDWGISDELIYQGDGIYEVIISIDVGGWEFKVASEDWSTVDLGNIGGGDFELGVPLQIGPAGGANLFVDIAVAGLYSFMLDTTIDPNRSLQFPLLTISALAIPAPGTLALIGLSLLLFARNRKTR